MKSLTTLILSMFLCSSAYAEDMGQFTFLGTGQCAPFEGTLFDAKATSRLLTLAHRPLDRAHVEATRDWNLS